MLQGRPLRKALNYQIGSGPFGQIIEVRNHSGIPLYIGLVRSRSTGQLFVDVSDVPFSGSERVERNDYIQPTLKEE